MLPFEVRGALKTDEDQLLTVAQHLDTVNLPDQHTPLTVRSFGLTDPAKVRDANQDQFLIAVLRKALQVRRTSLPAPKVQPLIVDQSSVPFINGH